MGVELGEVEDEEIREVMGLEVWDVGVGKQK